MERGRLKNLPFFGSGFQTTVCVKFLTDARAFRLTKSKFQILSIFSHFVNFFHFFPTLSIFPLLSKFCQFFNFFRLPIFYNFPNSSQFFQKFHFLPIFSLFSQILPFSLNLVSSAGSGVFQQDDRHRTKILLLFQILTVVFSWDWSWEFDMSWSGPHQNFQDFPNFGKCFQLGKAGIVLVLNCPKFPNFGKAENFFQNEKNLKSWKILVGLKFVEKEPINFTYQKKAPFSHR